MGKYERPGDWTVGRNYAVGVRGRSGAGRRRILILKKAAIYNGLSNKTRVELSVCGRFLKMC